MDIELQIQLYQGDCLEVMKQIPDKSVDMVLCDLPYGTTACSWDIVIPFEPLWNEYNRIIKDNGVVALFGQEPFSSYLRISNIKNYKYDWYWKKERLTNITQVKKRAGKVIETISIFYSKQPIYNPQMTVYTGIPVKNKPKNGVLGKLVDSSTKPVFAYEDNGLRYPIQLLEFSRNCNTSEHIHPTQKPVALLEYLIKTYTNGGGVLCWITVWALVAQVWLVLILIVILSA